MNLNEYAAEVHAANQKWWHDIQTGERLKRNKGEMLCLIHSEISECLEGVRKGLSDDHLPHRSMEEVELADALIRILDYAAGHGLDLQGAYEDKMAYNAQRVDHKVENRLLSGGKKF
jgi:NTP pyrophosphatase (non-canonical NTP hydrolase)